MTPRRVSILFAVLALFVWQVEWQYSPLRRIVAWGSLKVAAASMSPEQTISNLKTVTASGSAPLSSIVSDASQLFLNVSTKEVSHTTVAVPYGHNMPAIDPLLPQSITYVSPGVAGTQIQYTKRLIIDGKERTTFTELGDITEQPVNQQIIMGTKDTAAVQTDIETQWKNLVTALKNKDTKAAIPLLATADKDTVPLILALKDLDYRLAATAKVSIELSKTDPEYIVVGNVALQQSNCPSGNQNIPLAYEFNLETGRYRFKDVALSLTALCIKPVPLTNSSTTTGTGTVLTCKNCWLAPVSKQYQLSANYAPAVIPTGLNGGGYLTTETVAALSAMFTDMQAKGLTPRVSSSYRSYQTQVTLFNSYVADEQKAGLTYTQAVAKANTYSAKPGNSEHQLGTTLDLVGCPSACSFYNSLNTSVYDYLKANAYKYGFILSYPNGSQPFTGYVYEPWHVRYIGITRAMELYNKGYLTNTGYYLYQYLLEKGEY